MKNFKISIVITIFSCIILPTVFSCNRVPTEVLWQKTEDFTIVNIDPPKHFYLDLKRVSDGRVFTHVWIGKHCSNMCISVGDTIKATYGKYKNGNDTWEEFDILKIRNMVCNCK